MSIKTPNRREFLQTASGGFFVSLRSASAREFSGARPEGQGSNILLIADDQHNARNLGCYGDPLVKTPNLDRLAARGIRFTRAYSQSMICAPSRVSMITGQYVHSHGYYGNHGPHNERALWLTSYLRRHGYQTAMVGKAHYGYDKVAQEFDFFRLCDRIDTPPDNLEERLLPATGRKRPGQGRCRELRVQMALKPGPPQQFAPSAAERFYGVPAGGP